MAETTERAERVSFVLKAWQMVSAVRVVPLKALTGGTTFILDGDLGLETPVYKRCKALLHGQSLLLIERVIQRQQRAVSLLASRMQPLV